MISSQLLAASGGFWSPIANPLSSVLAFFYGLIPNYGIAIVLLTIAMMIVLTPLTIKQTRSMLVMQKLQPEMKRLQAEHKNDRQALNEAVVALYKEHNASPLGGCLPMLLPFPLFIALLKVLEGLSRLVRVGTGKSAHLVSSPKYLSANTLMYKNIVKAGGKLDAWGVDLAKAAKNAGGGFGHELPYFVLLLLMVGTQFYQQYQMTSKNPAMQSQPGQAMMMKIVPIIFGIFSLEFAAGVVVYWTVSNIIRIGTQWALYRYDPKVKSLVAQDVKEVEAKTREIDERGAKSKSKSSSPKPATSGRPRLRDMLNDASKAATERRTASGKGTARPDAKGGSSPGAGKAGAPGAAKGGGGQKAAQARPPTKSVPAKPGTGRTGPSKATPSKAGLPAKGGPPGTGSGPRKAAPSPGKAAAGPGKAAPGPAKGAPGKGGSGKAPAATGGSPKNGTAPAPAAGKAASAPGGQAVNAGSSTNGTPKAGGSSQAGAGTAMPAIPSPATNNGGAGGDRVERATADISPGGTDGNLAEGKDALENGTEPVTSCAAGGTNGANGADGSAANGDGTDGAEVAGAATALPGTPEPIGNGSPAKGRTGGGSARNVTSNRRRKGR
ncbi:MAG TPA: membrane protein insertase YidC [Acidimicrobiales bacterium]|nr:membrane protein insertase YidC [Acidimicrobiales bacterium]